MKLSELELDGTDYSVEGPHLTHYCMADEKCRQMFTEQFGDVEIVPDDVLPNTYQVPAFAKSRKKHSDWAREDAERYGTYGS